MYLSKYFFWRKLTQIDNYWEVKSLSYLEMLKAVHSGPELSLSFWRVTPETYGRHETRAKNVWETSFIQILGIPSWLKDCSKMAALNIIFRKVPKFKIWNHFVIAKPATTLHFLWTKIFLDVPVWNNDLYVFLPMFCL